MRTKCAPPSWRGVSICSRSSTAPRARFSPFNRKLRLVLEGAADAVLENCIVGRYGGAFKPRGKRANQGSLAVFLFSAWRAPTLGVVMTLTDHATRRRDSASARDDYRVIRWKEWYQSKVLSKWAANRLRKAGKGPRIVQLTDHAVGVTVKDDREWTEARIRKSAAA